VERIRRYLRVTRAAGIVRRYFAMNGFDGAMTILGITLGSWAAQVENAEIIVSAGMGACIAMGISGFSGAYMAEKAERERHLKELEEKTNNNVDPIHYEASEFISIFGALVSGLSPVLTATISILPFAFTLWKLVPISIAYPASVLMTLATLFVLGAYLGKVAKETMWFYGAKMLAAGLVTMTVIYIVETML